MIAHLWQLATFLMWWSLGSLFCGAVLGGVLWLLNTIDPLEVEQPAKLDEATLQKLMTSSSNVVPMRRTGRGR